MSTDRRKFLARGGLISAFIGGVVSAPIVVEKIKEIRVEPEKQTIDPQIEAKLEEFGSSSTFQLTKSYGEIEDVEVKPTNYIFLPADTPRLFVSRDGPVTVHGSLGTTTKRIKSETLYESSVGIVPGPDGNLYVKINGKWQKVLTT